MRVKLLMLAIALSLAAVASSSAGPGQIFILCGTCTSTNPSIPCRCEANSLNPGYVSNCDVWPRACWNGFPP